MSKVYVGTYRKYNDGSIQGDWLDLEDYECKKDFIKAWNKVMNADRFDLGKGVEPA